MAGHSICLHGLIVIEHIMTPLVEACCILGAKQAVELTYSIVLTPYAVSVCRLSSTLLARSPFKEALSSKIRHHVAIES